MESPREYSYSYRESSWSLGFPPESSYSLVSPIFTLDIVDCSWLPCVFCCGDTAAEEYYVFEMAACCKSQRHYNTASPSRRIIVRRLICLLFVSISSNARRIGRRFRSARGTSEELRSQQRLAKGLQSTILMDSLSMSPVALISSILRIWL